MDIEEKWKYTPKKGEQYLFMHIPKTGGTTFRKMLTTHFPEGSYYPSKEDLLANRGKYYTQKELITEQTHFLKKPLIVGHFNIELVKHLLPNVKVISFFRNPMDRILSHVKHIIRHDPEFIGANPNEVIHRKIKNICLTQSLRMGFIPKKKNFEDVKYNIDQLDFVGITEFFDESIELINRQFNWLLEPCNIENRNEEPIYPMLSLETKALISSYMGKELHTYNCALKIFNLRSKI